jgi:hypothetical protein
MIQNLKELKHALRRLVKMRTENYKLKQKKNLFINKVTRVLYVAKLQADINYNQRIQQESNTKIY